MLNILERLKYQTGRKSTNETYLRIWRQFNKFVIKLDWKPKSWEEKASIFAAYLIDKGAQSCSIRSYISAIKKVLTNDGYQWNDNLIALASLTRSCKLVNDCVQMRLPIQCGLLELILFEIKRYYNNNRTQQKYLETMYLALFTLGYYGLMRVGELTESPHVLRAENVHMATNKEKLLVVLYSSKTHWNSPQKIKITANNHYNSSKQFGQRNFCPFQLIRNYIKIKNSDREIEENEQFFTFSDGSAVTPYNARWILKKLISNLGLDCTLYSFHSLRIGRTTDLIKKFNYSLEEVKRAGRWKSNVVYKYIRS